MKCKLCGQKAVINMRQHRLALCKVCYPQWFLKQTRRTIEHFKMLRAGEKVLVAVSGGKDSLGLWFALDKLGYETAGLYLDLGIDTDDYSTLSKQYTQQLSQKLGKPLYIVPVEEAVGKPVPGLVRRSERKPCSMCGLVKRYFMNRFALEHGFDTLATGHNLDDEAATLLSNVLHWNEGYLARQSPVLPAREGFVKRIKPFFRFTEKETALFAVLSGIDYIENECPFSYDAISIMLKNVLNQIEENSPGTKLQFYQEFMKVREKFGSDDEVALQPCQKCRMPTTGDVCALCRAIERTGGEVLMVYHSSE